jgi:hypothetical protein
MLSWQRKICALPDTDGLSPDASNGSPNCASNRSSDHQTNTNHLSCNANADRASVDSSDHQTNTNYLSRNPNTDRASNSTTDTNHLSSITYANG